MSQTLAENLTRDMVCHRHCGKIGQFRHLDLCFEMKNIIHNTYILQLIYHNQH